MATLAELKARNTKSESTTPAHYKSESAKKVLLLMDSPEYESKSYSDFVQQVAKEDSITVEQLEIELDPFI